MALARYVKAFGRTARLFATAPIDADARLGLRNLADHLAGEPDGNKGGEAPGLPEVRLDTVDLDTLWPSSQTLPLSEFSAGNHNVMMLELIALCVLARLSKPTRMFEFGTFDGRTGANLLRTCPEVHLTTLDLPDGRVDAQTAQSRGGPIGWRMHTPDLEGRWEQIKSVSAEYDYSSLAGTMDFVFVDAGHTYDLVRNDTAAALKLLKPDGIIAWHDYGHLQGRKPFPGLTRAVDEFFAGQNGAGPAPGKGIVIRGTRVAACVPPTLLEPANGHIA